MKKIIYALGVLSLLVCCSMSYADTFNSGSTGSLGAFNPTVDTEVTLPSDGILHYATVNIPAGVTVTFKNVSSYNSPVYMLATGDVVIAGTIAVSGTAGSDTDVGHGGPGGFDGGYGGMSGGAAGTAGGKGKGPGGGYPNTGSNGGAGGGFGIKGQDWSNAAGGPEYGNARLLPLIGGSGGGGGGGQSGGHGGNAGGGGGAILIASSTSISVTGSILANGGDYGQGPWDDDGGSGSGGGIKLVANSFSGNGTISAKGGNSSRCGRGGVGRIRIEAYDNYRTASTDPPYSFGQPGSIFVANEPRLKITSIGGTAIPANPTGNYNQPDIFLSYSTILNPVAVEVSAEYIPVPTDVKVWVVPQYGSATNSTATLSGSEQSSSCTAYVTITEDYAKVIMAEATFTVQQAMYYDGEKIEKVRVAASMGGKSETVYITESGREIKGELLAGLVR